ncbi:MAG: GTPase, partial [Candidatus Geothermarchaeota archaeon]
MNTIEIGLIGKPNTGKSTLFSAITLMDVPIANYPFTTLDAHVGIGYVKVNCVCTEFGVKDNPRNSFCIDGKRFIPIKVIDTAGLVKDAWKGRGLGNLFLDRVSRADALIHVVDASGSTNEDGEPIPPGTHDPVKDVELIHNELIRWIYGIIIKDWSDIVKRISIRRSDPTETLFNKLSGLKFSKFLIATAYDKIRAEYGPLNKWGEEQILSFTKVLLERGKPIVIAANKIDYPASRY